MSARFSISVKIILLAFLNVLLLGVILAIFARIQFQADLGSIFLAASRERILSVSRLIALELPTKPQSEWGKILEVYSATYPAKFYLFDSFGNQLAGPVIPPPKAIEEFLTSDRNRHNPNFERPSSAAPPPLFLACKALKLYWIAVHVPIWRDPSQHPMHGNLLWVFPSFWTNPFFFDYRPWLLVVLAVVLVSVLCWAPLIRGLTRSISDISRATGQIAKGHFEISLSTRRRDELGQLSGAINRMAQRLESYVHGQKRFLRDVAHELCSPIARMQMALGVLAQRAGEEQKNYVADVQEEVEHMSGLINELLSFSKAEMHSRAKELVTVNVREIAARAIERESWDGVVIENLIPEGTKALADAEYLFRSLANVVRNAVRYAGHAGPIEISAQSHGNDVAIVVADHGPGVPEAELTEIFKPFYRPEFARQRETGGTGLGLAIVKTCIEACDGGVAARNRNPSGLEIEIRLKSM